MLIEKSSLILVHLLDARAGRTKEGVIRCTGIMSYRRSLGDDDIVMIFNMDIHRRSVSEFIWQDVKTVSHSLIKKYV